MAESRIVSYDYFMDVATVQDIGLLMDIHNYSYRPILELLRLSPFMTVRVNSKKKWKITDICPLPWDEVDDKKKKKTMKSNGGDTHISDEDIKRLKEQSERYAAMRNSFVIEDRLT